MYYNVLWISILQYVPQALSLVWRLVLFMLWGQRVLYIAERRFRRYATKAYGERFHIQGLSERGFWQYKIGLGPCKYTVLYSNCILIVNYFLQQNLSHLPQTSQLNLDVWPLLCRSTKCLMEDGCFLNCFFNYQVSIWRCTVTEDPHIQPAEVCARHSPCLVPPYHPLLFSYCLHCHVKWCGRISCLFQMCSASPRLPVLHALLYETSAHTGML